MMDLNILGVVELVKIIHDIYTDVVVAPKSTQYTLT
jgi:hypothetical protein